MRVVIYTILWALFLTFVCYYIFSQRQNVDLATSQEMSNTEQQVEVINEIDGSSYLNDEDDSTLSSETSITDESDEDEGSNDSNTDEADNSSTTIDGGNDSEIEKTNNTASESPSKERDYAKNFIEKAYIEFGQNSTKLPKSPQFDTYLDSVANLLSGGEHEVILVGHADSATSRKQNNYQVGLSRAEFVKGLLTAKKVAGNIITVLSEGDESPRVEGNTAEARTLNRRVELFIKQKN